MLFDEALRVLWTQWMFCWESLTTKDISAELSDVIDLVISVLQENVSSLIYVLLRENMHFSSILGFNDFHMEQFCHVCWKEGHLFQFFSPLLPTKWALSCVHTCTSHLKLNKPESFFCKGVTHLPFSCMTKWTVSSENSEGRGSIVGEEIFSMAPSVRGWLYSMLGPHAKIHREPPYWTN